MLDASWRRGVCSFPRCANCKPTRARCQSGTLFALLAEHFLGSSRWPARVLIVHDVSVRMRVPRSARSQVRVVRGQIFVRVRQICLLGRRPDSGGHHNRGCGYGR